MLTPIFYIFIAVVAIEIIQLTLLYGPISSSRPAKKNTLSEPISVIAYFSEQDEKLDSFLQTLITQQYPTYELILVYNSTENHDTEKLEKFCKANPIARLVNVENIETFWSNKKYALTLGIKVAKYERFVFTEPTTLPVSDQWLLALSNAFTPTKKVVLGHTQIAKQKGSFINKLIRFQNTYKTIDLFAWSKLGKPLHGNAYNQSYTKELFFEVNGFIDHMKTPYSDEFAFINQIATRKNTTIAKDKNSFVQVEVENKSSTWTSRIKQYDLLLRTTSIAAQLKIRFFNLCHLLFYALFILLASTFYNWEIVIGLFVFRYVLLFFYNYRLFKVFNNKDLIWTLPLLEIIHIFTTTYYSIVHFITRQKI